MKRGTDDPGSSSKRQQSSSRIVSDSACDSLGGMETQAGSGLVPTPRAIHPPLAAEFNKLKIALRAQSDAYSQELSEECKKGIADANLQADIVIKDICHQVVEINKVVAAPSNVSEYEQGGQDFWDEVKAYEAEPEMDNVSGEEEGDEDMFKAPEDREFETVQVQREVYQRSFDPSVLPIKFDYDHWYRDIDGELPKNKTLRAVASENINRIKRFWTYAQSRIGETEVIVEDSDLERPTKVTTDPPCGHAVLYQVVYYTGASFQLTPVHLEVVAGKFPHLQFLTLNNASYDSVSKKRFNLKEIEIGDLFFIEDIKVFERKKDQQPMKDMTEVNTKESHNYWLIAKAARLPRCAFTDTLAYRWDIKGQRKAKFYLAEKLTAPAELSRNLPSADANPLWLKVTTMVPAVQPGRHIRGFSPEGEEQLAHEVFRPHQPMWNLRPIIVKRESLDADSQMLVDHMEQQLSESTPGDSYEKLTRSARMVHFSACAHMAVGNFCRDNRSYPGKITETSHSATGIGLAVKVQHNPKDALNPKYWTRNSLVSIKLANETFKGKLLALVTDLEKNHSFTIRLNQWMKVDQVLALKHEEVFIQQLVEDTEQTLRTQIGRLLPPPPPKDKDGEEKCILTCNAIEVLAAVLGGVPVKDINRDTRVSPVFTVNNITVNRRQAEILALLKDKRIPGGIVHCPYGSGKTTAIVASLIVYSKEHPQEWLAFSAQSNHATVQGVKAWLKLDPLERVRAVRMVSGTNRLRIDPTMHTPIDFPILLWQVLKKALLKYDVAYTQTELSVSVARHLANFGYIDHRTLRSKTLRDACTLAYKKDPPAYSLFQAFVAIYKPTLWFATAASLRQMFQVNQGLKKLKHKVSIVALDESSQLSRAALMAIAFSFPSARIFAIGDSLQLPPYQDTQLPEVLGKTLNGPWFSEAVVKSSLPIIHVTDIYRCRDQATSILSQVFYENKLASKYPIDYQLPKLQQVGFESNHPFQWIDTNSEEEKDGTSFRNPKEVLVAKKLINRMISTNIKPEQIHVIATYAAQTNIASAVLPTSVRVTTTDGAQGSEADYVVVLTTKRMCFQKSKFVASGNRALVALSRARIATIILSNFKAMAKADAWQKVFDAGSIKDRTEADRIEWLQVRANEINDFKRAITNAEDLSSVRVSGGPKGVGVDSN